MMARLRQALQQALPAIPLCGLGSLLKGVDAASGGLRPRLGWWASPGRGNADTQRGHNPHPTVRCSLG